MELILKILTFKISDVISHFTKYRQDFLEKEVYTYLPDIRKLGIKDITEEDFYKLIGLTQEEINIFKNDNVQEEKIENFMPDIIIKGKTKYYVIKTLVSSVSIDLGDKEEVIETFEDYVHKIKRDKSIGEYIGIYKDGNII